MRAGKSTAQPTDTPSSLRRDEWCFDTANGKTPRARSWAERPPAGTPDTEQSSGAVAAPAGDETPGKTWMTKPVAYATGATSLGALILAAGLFTFLRRRRPARVLPSAFDPDQTMRM